MAQVSLKDVVVRKAGTVSAMVDGELAVLDPSSGAYYGLDAIASAIWTGIEQPISVRVLADSLIDRFDGEAGTIESDLVELLCAWTDEGLIEVRT